MYGNGYSMAIVLDHRSTATSLTGNVALASSRCCKISSRGCTGISKSAQNGRNNVITSSCVTNVPLKTITSIITTQTHCLNRSKIFSIANTKKSMASARKARKHNVKIKIALSKENRICDSGLIEPIERPSF